MNSKKLALHLKNRGKQNKKLVTGSQTCYDTSSFNPFPHISTMSLNNVTTEMREETYFSGNIFNTSKNNNSNGDEFLKRFQHIEEHVSRPSLRIETTDKVDTISITKSENSSTIPSASMKISIKENPYRTIIHNNALLVSRDYGASWNSPVKPPSSSVTFSFVAVGEKVQVSLGRFDPIYHSLDNGETWKICSNQPQIHDWAYVKICEEDDRIEAGTTNGLVYVSTDLGYNWSQ
jgi:hypothetical protein